MIKHIVIKKENNKTIERILLSNYNIDKNTLYKAFRKRDIKINGKRISSNSYVNEGDVIEAYVYEKEKDITIKEKFYDTVYEDDKILIINKKQGISVSENLSDDFSLIKLINKENNSFELCHRLDRNTGGLLILSKDTKYTDLIKEEINNRFYNKIYKCIVYGDASNLLGKHKAWHFKDSEKNIVYIYNERKKYAKEIITEILDVKYNVHNNTSEMRINLITGRTHQIRAHMAFLGHFVVGDGKYGMNELNKKFKYKYQALWAHGLERNISVKSLYNILPDRNFYSTPMYE